MRRSEPSSESPAELVERIRSREDRDAENRLVERYAGGVRILLERHTRAAVEAEDLFQETFRLALAKLRRGELREPSKLAGFLASLARNLAIEHYRKESRRRTEADSVVAEAVACDLVTSEAGGQLGQLLRAEEARLVRQILDELSTDRDREILFRFYIAEEDKERIAADFGMDGVQLNRVLYRARQRYKSLWRDRLEDPGHPPADPVATAVLGAPFTFAAIVRLLESL